MRRTCFATLIVLAQAVLVAASAFAAEQGPTVPKEKTPLFNGKDLTGWTFHLGKADVDPKTVWSVKDGVIRCEGSPAGYMQTTADYADYKLHLEWRWPEGGGNSGVLLHMTGRDAVWPRSIECQLMAGRAGDFYLIDGTDFNEHQDKSDTRVPRKKESSEKPLGEWNAYDIACRGNSIHVYVNGVLQNVATGTTVAAGKICLQSEGKPIEFRNLYLEPPAPLFTLKDQDEKDVSLSDLAGKIVVLEWMNYDCPVSRRHYDRGTFDALAEKYKDQGVVWLAVNSTHYSTPERNRKFAQEHNVPYPILDDRTGEIGRKYGAKTTPHICIVQGGSVVYSGAIDDDPGGNKAAPVNYVERAIEEILAGKPLSTPRTQPYGCSVKYAK